MKICAIIVAAGRGLRAGGGMPKQFRDLAGKPVLTRTYEQFAKRKDVDSIVVVMHPDDRSVMAELGLDAILVDGGDTRKASVTNGLEAVPNGTTHVLIHDGARPCVPKAVIDRVIGALETDRAAAPALSVIDALWRTEDGEAVEIVRRDSLSRAQTPQGFELSAIRIAHAKAGPDIHDDVAAALAGGIKVAVVAGDEKNIKITNQEDFERAKRILESELDIRTGTGFDVHRFAAGDAVILCGISVPHIASLSGHSDADVAMHAITDAIYGALADGDIGQHFPPSDPQWKGAASDIFLRHAVKLAEDRGYRISNLDCTIMCEEPKIGPHAEQMRKQLSQITAIDVGRISVKATTTERLGFTGRKEGIAAQAAATLIKQ